MLLSFSAFCGEEGPAQTIQNMFDALSTGHYDKYKEFVSTDFYLFDMGEKLTGEQFAILIEKTSSNIQRRWEIRDVKVNISGNLAWVTYLNHGTVKRQGKTPEIVEVEWLESAVLELRKSRWVLLFLHSTKVAHLT